MPDRIYNPTSKLNKKQPPQGNTQPSCKCKFEPIDSEVLVTDKNNMNNNFASATITRVDFFFCPECLKTEEKERIFYWTLDKDVPSWAKLETTRLVEEYNSKARY